MPSRYQNVWCVMCGERQSRHLNVEQAGQGGPHSPTQVTQQAVGDPHDLLGTFSTTPAPLGHQPSKDARGFDDALISYDVMRATHRRKDSSIQSAHAELSPTHTHGPSASPDRQPETDWRQKSTKPGTTEPGSPPIWARGSMSDACAWRVIGMGPMEHQGEELSWDIGMVSLDHLFTDLCLVSLTGAGFLTRILLLCFFCLFVCLLLL